MFIECNGPECELFGEYDNGYEDETDISGSRIRFRDERIIRFILRSAVISPETTKSIGTSHFPAYLHSFRIGISFPSEYSACGGLWVRMAGQLSSD